MKLKNVKGYTISARVFRLGVRLFLRLAVCTAANGGTPIPACHGTQIDSNGSELMKTPWGCEAKYIPLLTCLNTTINKAWQYSVHSRIILECAGDVEFNPGPPKTRQTILSTGNANGGADGIQIVNKAADMDRGNVTLLDVMKEIRAVKTSVNDIKKSIETVKGNYSELKEEIKELKTENTNLKGVVNCQNSRDKGPPEGNSARG